MRKIAYLGTASVLAMLVGCAQDSRNRQPVVVGSGGPPPGAVYAENGQYGQHGQYGQPAQYGAVESLQPGTQLWVELDSTISPRNAPGEPFAAHVEKDIVSQDGAVLVPEGAVVTGRVDEIRQAYGDQPMGVRLTVTDLEMGGIRQPLHGNIVQADVQGRNVRGRDVAIGAGAGAILGAILEGGKGALVGGAVGAGAGALISLGRSGDGSNELPRGSKLAIELQAPIRTMAGLRSGGRYY